MQCDEGLKSFLGGIALFGGLGESTLERIASMLVEHQFDRGSVVCRQGESGRSLYVVARGEVIVCRQTQSGQLVRMVRLGKGEFFGEMTLIDVQPRSATVIVEEPATLYALTNRDLYRLYREDVDGYIMVLQNICRELSRRLRRADSRVAELATEVESEGTQIGVRVRS